MSGSNLGGNLKRLFQFSTAETHLCPSRTVETRPCWDSFTRPRPTFVRLERGKELQVQELSTGRDLPLSGSNGSTRLRKRFLIRGRDLPLSGPNLWEIFPTSRRPTFVRLEQFRFWKRFQHRGPRPTFVRLEPRGSVEESGRKAPIAAGFQLLVVVAIARRRFDRNAAIGEVIGE